MNSVDLQKWQTQSDSGPGSKLEQESLLPELLHALNQPLTSLRCSLELTLLQPRDSEEYRKRLRESLRLTEDIVVLSTGIRELLDVEQPSGTSQGVAFERVLQSSVHELLPLAETRGVRLALSCPCALPVLGDSQRYLAALLYFLGFLFSFASKSDELRVNAHLDGKSVALSLVLNKADTNDASPAWEGSEGPGGAKSYLRLLIARRIFEIEGGCVSIDRQRRRISLSVKLPQGGEIAAVSREDEPITHEGLPQSA